MPMLLTRETVIAQQVRFKNLLQRASRHLVIVAIPWVIFAGMMVLVGLGPDAVPPLMPMWAGVLLVVAMAITFGGAAWYAFRMSVVTGKLRCPCCQAAIGNVTTLFQVMASHRCPHCEEVILGDGEARFMNPVVKVPWPTYEQLEAKDFCQRMAPWGLTAAFWCIVTKLLLDHWQSRLEATVGEIAFPFVRALVAAPGAVVFSLGILWVYRSLEARSPKCVHCREVLGGPVVALTGCCGQCGSVARPDRVIAPDEPPTKNMLGVKEFGQLARNAGKQTARKVTRMAMITFPILFAAMAANRWIGEKLWIALSFAALALFLRGMWKIDQIEKQIKCDSCSQPLLRHHRWVIASRRCGGCGRRVLKD